jgi:hypothetical protein
MRAFAAARLYRSRADLVESAAVTLLIRRDVR